MSENYRNAILGFTDKKHDKTPSQEEKELRNESEASEEKPCKHESDGLYYTSNPPKLKCVKCGKFYGYISEL